MALYTTSFRNCETVEDLKVMLDKQFSWLMCHLNHLNVKQLFTEYCDIRSENGETQIKGPQIIMKDADGNVKLLEGLDPETGLFVFTLLDGIITGGTVRTAQTGERIEMSSNQLRSYNAANQLNGIVTNATPGEHYGDVSFYDNGLETMRIENILTGNGWVIKPMNGATLYIGTPGDSVAIQGVIDSSSASYPNLNDGTDNYATYSSGTFTPVIKGSSTAGSNTYGFQAGFYYRIGKMCFFDAQVQLSAKDAAMAGNISIDGLPFTAKNDTNRKVSCSISYIRNFTHDATKTLLTARIVENTAAISLLNNGDNTPPGSVTAAQINATTQLAISGAYEIA